MGKKRCYYCRWKIFKGELTKDDAHKTTKGCIVCEVLLCEGYFL